MKHRRRSCRLRLGFLRLGFRRKHGLIPVLAIGLSCILLAEEPSSLPADPSEKYRVGITEFDAVLTDTNAYLASSLPLSIIEAVETCDSHVFGDPELLAYKMSLIDTEIGKRKVSLGSMYAARDRLFFQVGTESEQFAAAEKRITDTLDEITELELTDPDTITIRREKPIELHEQNRERRLLPFPETAESEYASAEKVDLLISGRVEEIQGFIFLEVWIYMSALDERIYLHSDAASLEGISEKIDAPRNHIAEILLGRPWAGLSLLVTPPTAEVTINGTSRGSGSADLRLIEPGEYLVEVSAKGYTPESRLIIIDPYERIREEFILKEASTRELLFRSRPQGASVFLSSEFQGTTPSLITYDGDISQATLRLDGYEEQAIFLNPKVESLIAVDLKPILSVSEPYRERTRDAFYGSLAAFALSIPASLVLYSVQSDYLTAARQAEGDEQLRLWNVSLGTVAGFIGGVFLNATLFVNSVVRLVEYVQASDRE